MPREKLYNVHKTTYFIAALFVFKTDKILSVKFRLCKNTTFLIQYEFVYSYFIYLPLDIFYLKKQNVLQDTARKALQFKK